LTKEKKYSIEDVTSFPIANAAVTDAQINKKCNQLRYTHSNQMDFINPESAENIEKGWMKRNRCITI
jgi:hypothetical protein